MAPELLDDSTLVDGFDAHEHIDMGICPITRTFSNDKSKKKKKRKNKFEVFLNL